MGRGRVDELEERFESSGFIEFQLDPIKVVVHIAFYLLMIPIFGGIAATVCGPLAGALVALLFVLLLAVLCITFGEQLIGVGPALKVDADGLTLRRWGKPLWVPWSDLVGVNPFRMRIRVSHMPVRSAPMVGIQLSETAWKRFRDGRPRLLNVLDPLIQWNGTRTLVLNKILDAPAADIAKFLDTVRWHRQHDATAYAFTDATKTHPPILLLGAGLNGNGPLWFVNRREATLDEVPLTPELKVALRAWNARGPGENAGLDPSGAFDPALLDAWSNEGKALARRTEAELGDGAMVRFVYEVDLPS